MRGNRIDNAHPGRGVAQPGSASALGAEGRRFESYLPDQFPPSSQTVTGTKWHTVPHNCASLPNFKISLAV